MTLHPLDLGIIAVYLAGMLVLGLWAHRQAAAGIESYFLGNRSMPWWMLGASGMASNLDVTGTMINTALVFVLGTCGFFVELRGGVVLVLAMLMVCLGKWTRRSQVMTNAEWMHLRFGATRQGDVARCIAAASSILLTIAMVSYFSIGSGKFVAEFLGLGDALGLPDRFWGAVLLIGVALVYTVASGLYGVVLTDLAQGLLIFAAIACVVVTALVWHPVPESFAVPLPMQDGSVRLLATTREAWTGLWPPARLDLDPGSSYAAFRPFGLALACYLLKVLIEGFGGTGGYMAQRFYAARSDREAGLLALWWTVLLSFRWPFIAAIAAMGISYSATHGTVTDPERILPLVVTQMFPVGLKGLLLAGLMAAAMSTFDSEVNSGASYWVRDIYQAYLHPAASERTLVRQSRWASLAIVLAGLLLSLTVRNINEIWGWITMSIGAGLLVPTLVRWYWWRMNGYGYAAGVVAGMGAAVCQRLFYPQTPEYGTFALVSTLSLVGIVLGTLASAPSDPAVLVEFYRRVRPFGLWGPVRRGLALETRSALAREHRRDLAAVALAVPWQLALFLVGMMLVWRQWWTAAGLGAALVALSAGLYLVWFRHLGDAPPTLSRVAGPGAASR